MTYRQISKEDYGKLLELDRQVYPTSNPVTHDILDKWFVKNPEFGIMFEELNKMYGMCIVIPLSENGWKKLISGNLAEADLSEKDIFDNERDSKIGIHVYHIEKLDKSKKRFYKESLNALKEIINSLRITNPLLKVIGFSGLCVTSEGINLFYNKFNCREREFVNSEHILRKNDLLEIFDSDSQDDLREKLKDGYEYVNRCKMLISYSDEQSIIWDYLVGESIL